MCFFGDSRFVSGTNISIPTHYFAVLTSCKDSAVPLSACVGELQTVSFLLPHRPNNSESCKVRNHTVSTYPSVVSQTSSTRHLTLKLFIWLNMKQTPYWLPFMLAGLEQRSCAKKHCYASDKQLQQLSMKLP